MCLQGGRGLQQLFITLVVNMRKLWITVRDMRLLTAHLKPGHHVKESITHNTMLERICMTADRSTEGGRSKGKGGMEGLVAPHGRFTQATLFFTSQVG